MPEPWDIHDKGDWLARKIPGTLQSEHLLGEEGFLDDQENGCEVRYDVVVDGNTLKAELVEVIHSRTNQHLIWITTAVLLSMGLAIAVVVVVRRSKRIISASNE